MELLDQPRRVVPCAYWRCNEQAETWTRYGRPRDFHSPECQERAKTDKPPPEDTESSGSNEAAQQAQERQERLERALELLDDERLLKLARDARRSPLALTFLEVRDILHGRQPPRG